VPDTSASELFFKVTLLINCRSHLSEPESSGKGSCHPAETTGLQNLAGARYSMGCGTTRSESQKSRVEAWQALLACCSLELGMCMTWQSHGKSAPVWLSWQGYLTTSCESKAGYTLDLACRLCSLNILWLFKEHLRLFILHKILKL